MNAQQNPFDILTPEVVISTVEKALCLPCTNLCRPLNSYINRVYELEIIGGGGLVVKFYRPGRWSKEALLDEHEFLGELAEQEIPVIAPLKQLNGDTLGSFDGICFAVFPKKGGRSFDEYNDDQWLQMGRLLGRFHQVGELHLPKDRITLNPEVSTREHIAYLLDGNFVTPELCDEFSQVSNSLVDLITPLFASCEMIRIHGDCHFSNLIYRPDESFYIIDLDDMAVGPPVQDLWLLLPGYLRDSLVEVDIFLEGYETFRDFDRRTLGLIEPLRAMRYLHYTAWCAHQAAEEGLSKIVPGFGTYIYWQQEIKDLLEQIERIKKQPSGWPYY